MQQSDKPQNQYQIMRMQDLIAYIKRNFNISVQRNDYTKEELVTWLENVIKLDYKINDDDTLNATIGQPYIEQTDNTDLIVNFRTIQFLPINSNANFNKINN